MEFLCEEEHDVRYKCYENSTFDISKWQFIDGNVKLTFAQENTKKIKLFDANICFDIY